MKYYKYEDLGGEVIISEEDIIANYFPNWMQRINQGDSHKCRKLRELTEEEQKHKCIEDFLVTHWAYKYEPKTN